MREAEKLIDQNSDSVMVPNKSPFNKNQKLMSNDILDGLDEIEDLEDLEVSGKGFHFFGAGGNQKQPQAAPTIAVKQSPMGGLAQKKHSPPALALGPEKVTPLTNMAGHGRKSSSYGKKIGFDDDFDDDWDDTDRHGQQKEESEDWDDDYGL